MRIAAAPERARPATTKTRHGVMAGFYHVRTTGLSVLLG